jgi:regulator of replication initiation timing
MDNHQTVLEHTIEQAVTQIFACCRLQRADWDIDENLRLALQNDNYKSKIAALARKIDSTIELAEKSKIEINNKYKKLYKLYT